MITEDHILKYTMECHVDKVYTNFITLYTRRCPCAYILIYYTILSKESFLTISSPKLGFLYYLALKYVKNSVFQQLAVVVQWLGL